MSRLIDAERKAVLFDSFSAVCPFFTSDTDVNNGYGCTHINQSEIDDGYGKCFCWSCPLGFPAEQEDLNSSDIEWDNHSYDDDIEEDEYLIVNSGSNATDEELKALQNYENYINRYNQKKKRRVYIMANSIQKSVL